MVHGHDFDAHRLAGAWATAAALFGLYANGPVELSNDGRDDGRRAPPRLTYLAGCVMAPVANH